MDAAFGPDYVAPVQHVYRETEGGGPVFLHNEVVRHLFTEGGLAASLQPGAFPAADWEQFLQLIGVRVSEYLTGDDVREAAKAAAREAPVLGNDLCSARHPLQPLYLDEKGVARFRKNRVVRHLLARGPFDMDYLMTLEGPPQRDFEQFAQLFGYSLSGYRDLSFASDEA